MWLPTNINKGGHTIPVHASYRTMHIRHSVYIPLLRKKLPVSRAALYSVESSFDIGESTNTQYSFIARRFHKVLEVMLLPLG